MRDLFTQPTILSLFDHSGRWSQPYVEAGYNVARLDIKKGGDVRMIRADDHDNVVGILAAPPCTAFSVSGAQYWGAKDDDGTTADALSLVDAIYRLVAVFRPEFWVMENPVGRLKHYIGSPRMWFNPCDYGGHLSEDEVDAHAAELVRVYDLAPDVAESVAANTYTKKTGLWGEFCPELRPAPVDKVFVLKSAAASAGVRSDALNDVVAIASGDWELREGATVRVQNSVSNSQYSLVHFATGGKSDRTKELRSITPMGFARAFFEANNPANLERKVQPT